MYHNKVSAIVPTIGRLNSLQELFDSILRQTFHVSEVIVADGSASPEIEQLVSEYHYKHPKVHYKYIAVQPPNAVYQRQKAIEISTSDLLLLVDDDIVLEPDCIEHMLNTINSSPDVVAVCARLQQHQSNPTRLWSWYLKYVLKLRENEWQGRIVGPLLRFGYNPPPKINKKMEWLGTGNSLIRRSTFNTVGGFSKFFLHRCTMNEDIDLGIKLDRQGEILLCHNAYMTHNHAPSGRVSPILAAEDDLYNRFLILKNTLQYPFIRSFRLILLFFFIESLSDSVFSLKNFQCKYLLDRLYGRLKAITHIVKQGF